MYDYNVCNAIANKLTPDEIEAAYRYQQMNYATQDVINHVEDMYESGEFNDLEAALLKNDAVDIAELYIYKYSDCNLAENDVYEELIRNYLEDVNNQNYMLISVFEREINTKVFPDFVSARKQMVEELKAELSKDEDEYDISDDMMVDDNDLFGINMISAWSNIDDDCNCDWKIVAI